MKKIITSMLIAILTLSLFAGCTTKKADDVDAKTDESWNYIKNKETLIVGLDDTFCPMGFHDQEGTLVGFDIDLANAVGEKLGIKIEFQSINWDAKQMELDDKKIDCIWNGMSRTPERIEKMTLTKNYLKNKIAIMTTQGVTVNSLEDLKNYDIGIQAKSAALEVLQENDIYNEIKDKVFEYGTYNEVIMDIDAGRLQVMIVDEVLGEYTNLQRDDSKKLLLAGVDLGEDFYVIGMRKNEDALCAKINEALEALKADGKAEELSQKWFGKNTLAY